MGLFAFNKKNQTQPFNFLKLVSKWIPVSWSSVSIFAATSSSGCRQQVKTACVQGNISFAEGNNIYLWFYPAASKWVASITPLMSTAPRLPVPKAGLLAISPQCPSGDREKEGLAPLGLSGCAISGESQSFWVSLCSFVNWEGLSLPGDVQGVFLWLWLTSWPDWRLSLGSSSTLWHICLSMHVNVCLYFGNSWKKRLRKGWLLFALGSDLRRHSQWKQKVILSENGLMFPPNLLPQCTCKYRHLEPPSLDAAR